MKKLSKRQIFDIVLIILALIFIGQNIGIVPLKFLFIQFNLPLVIIIAVMFFIGFYTAKVFGSKKIEKQKEEENKKEE
jgi:uncharacterized integral membrane protein